MLSTFFFVLNSFHLQKIIDRWILPGGFALATNLWTQTIPITQITKDSSKQLFFSSMRCTMYYFMHQKKIMTSSSVTCRPIKKNHKNITSYVGFYFSFLFPAAFLLLRRSDPNISSCDIAHVLCTHDKPERRRRKQERQKNSIFYNDSVFRFMEAAMCHTSCVQKYSCITGR